MGCANIVGAGGAATSEIVYAALISAVLLLERSKSRALVRKAYVDHGVVLGCWHADLLQDVDWRIWNPRRQVTPR